MEASYKKKLNQVLEYKEILIQICKAKYLAKTDMKIHDNSRFFDILNTTS